MLVLVEVAVTVLYIIVVGSAAAAVVTGRPEMPVIASTSLLYGILGSPATADVGVLVDDGACASVLIDAALEEAGATGDGLTAEAGADDTEGATLAATIGDSEVAVDATTAVGLVDDASSTVAVMVFVIT